MICLCYSISEMSTQHMPLGQWIFVTLNIFQTSINKPVIWLLWLLNYYCLFLCIGIYYHWSLLSNTLNILMV